MLLDGRARFILQWTQALEYYRGTSKKARPLSSMTNRFSRVTSFITTRSLRNREEIEAAAVAFVESMKREMERYPLSISCNIDQTGINKKVVSNRTLAPIGMKQVSRVVQSMSSLTHSYTADPVLFADGQLGNKLVGSSAPPLTIVLLYSWYGFRDHENLVSEVLAGKELKLMTIPPGATSLSRPLDVYFFRLFKRFIWRIHKYVLHFRPDFNCFSRDNTLEVIMNRTSSLYV
ncbi:unnamed protein product [Heligmosomoides polygyrus]|uniref:Transposase n=1 Tax=Heligmosomoides polygyrus TaxID=6339 RepID=A0A183FP85_HELPZ|nr:unnamed protein product [Heligmosomoides polygyrus]